MINFYPSIRAYSQQWNVAQISRSFTKERKGSFSRGAGAIPPDCGEAAARRWSREETTGCTYFRGKAANAREPGVSSKLHDTLVHGRSPDEVQGYGDGSEAATEESRPYFVFRADVPGTLCPSSPSSPPCAPPIRARLNKTFLWHFYGLPARDIVNVVRATVMAHSNAPFARLESCYAEWSFKLLRVTFWRGRLIQLCNEALVSWRVWNLGGVWYSSSWVRGEREEWLLQVMLLEVGVEHLFGMGELCVEFLGNSELENWKLTLWN